MKFKALYAAGIICTVLFGAFYTISLSAPHRAMPWLVIAYAIFPVALILLILAETDRRRTRLNEGGAKR
jgi:hypothetical protein